MRSLNINHSMARRTRTPKFFNRPNQTNSLDYVWTISPNIVNEALATVSLDDVYIPVDRRTFTIAHRRASIIRIIFPQGKLLPTEFRLRTLPG